MVAAWAGSPIDYIFTAFENGSPLYWDVDSSGAVQVYLNYDVERGAVNRQTTHWHFQVHAQPGASLILVLNNFDNIWNGRPSSALRDNTTCVLSEDGETWRATTGHIIDGNRFQLDITMKENKLYIARMEPYTLSDLKTFLDSIRDDPRVDITTIGETVEGRSLEIIKVGRDRAPFRVLIRARAHPWEAGGNWMVQGLVNSLLADDPANEQYLQKYCLYVLPMANKDGVVRGLTRFNMMGMDLNRKWDKKADPDLSPENHALESWLESTIKNDKKPHLAFDMHNDSGGKLHIAGPNVDLQKYLQRMKTFEQLLTEHTWFTEGSTGGSYRNPGSFGEGLLERYGIDAFVYELNANWSAGLDKIPMGADWELLGSQLRRVLFDHFSDD